MHRAGIQMALCSSVWHEGTFAFLPREEQVIPLSSDSAATLTGRKSLVSPPSWDFSLWATVEVRGELMYCIVPQYLQFISSHLLGLYFCFISAEHIVQYKKRKIKPIRSNQIIKHSRPFCRKSQYVKIQIHWKCCFLALREAALSAWPLWPADTTGRRLCPGQRPELSHQQWLHCLLWAPLLLLPSSQVWRPCHCSRPGCGFCVRPHSASCSGSSLGALEEESHSGPSLGALEEESHSGSSLGALEEEVCKAAVTYQEPQGAQLSEQQ